MTRLHYRLVRIQAAEISLASRQTESRQRRNALQPRFGSLRRPKTFIASPIDISGSKATAWDAAAKAIVTELS
jgi:hypothetical protein